MVRITAKKESRMAYRSAGRAKKRAYTIELDREKDGRWIAEILQLPGVMAYGKSGAQGEGPCFVPNSIAG